MWTCGEESRQEPANTGRHRQLLANPELILEGQQGSGFYSQRPKAQEETRLGEFLTERH